MNYLKALKLYLSVCVHIAIVVYLCLDCNVRFFNEFLPFIFYILVFNPTLHSKDIQDMLLMFSALFGDTFILEKTQGVKHKKHTLRYETNKFRSVANAVVREPNRISELENKNNYYNKFLNRTCSTIIKNAKYIQSQYLCYNQ